MKNQYTYEDLQDEALQSQSLSDTEKFYKILDSECDGGTNTGFDTFEDAIENINTPVDFTQDQANTFFAI